MGYKQKGRKTPDRGKRVSLWVPAEDLDVLEKIDDLVNVSELAGVPTSRGAQILRILKRGLKRAPEERDGKEDK